jgi:hypothetical protein
MVATSSQTAATPYRHSQGDLRARAKAGFSLHKQKNPEGDPGNDRISTLSATGWRNFTDSLLTLSIYPRNDRSMIASSEKFMKRVIPALMAALFLIAGCATMRSTHSLGQQGSPYHPPDPQLVHSQTEPPPTSRPVPVNLSADGYFTAEGMRISFLRECAENTLKDGYDSFALFHYAMMQPHPRHYEAHGTIIEAHGRVEDRSKNVFDARKVLADPVI